MNDSNRFVIVCPARSGSTMLVHLLRSHPDCVSNSEVMAFTDGLGGFDPKVRGFVESLGSTDELVRRRRRDPKGFMKDAAFHGDGHLWCGFKMKSDELIQRKYSSVLDALREDTSIKVLHLNRANLLHRYVSWVMVNKQTGVTMAVREEDVPVLEPIEISPKKAKRDFEVAEERRALLDTWFASHDVLQLDYDDISIDPVGQTARICDFLDLERRVLTTPTIKIAPDVRTLVSNFDELVDHFAGTRFEHLFDLPDEPRAESDATQRSIARRAPIADEDAYRIPGRLRHPSEEWGSTGAPFDAYLAAICDLDGLAQCNVLAVGDHTDMVEAVAARRCAVASYTGLEDSAAYVEFCAMHPPDSRVRLVRFDATRLRDDTMWLVAQPADVVVVRSTDHAATVDLTRVLASGLRSAAADGARMVISFPLDASPTRPRQRTEACAGTSWSLDDVVTTLAATGWRVDEVREPRRTLDFHVVCTAVDRDE